MGCILDRSNVTVAMPTYNRADLLRGAIASALAQDYSDFDVMIVDNASTDCTEAVVRSFADPRLKYVRNHTIDELGLTLANYADRAQLRAIAERPEAEPWG